jgi:hypothetical protein
VCLLLSEVAVVVVRLAQTCVKKSMLFDEILMAPA